MRKVLFYLLLCSVLVGPVQAQPPVWGVIHSIHTTVSDGTESLSQRTDNLRMYYDFASTVDHDFMITSSEWFQTIDEVNAYQSLPDFVYFVGYEWMGVSSHHAEVTAFFVGDAPSVKVDGDDPNYDTFGEFATWLSMNNGIACVNHPARADNTVMWIDTGVRNEQIYPCVEMLNKQDYHWSDQWICAEGSGCTTYDNPHPPARSDWRGSVKNALDRGLRLGFVAAWDYHGKYPGTPTAYTGLAGVTEWARGALVEAVRKRHTWAAEDYIWMQVTSGTYIMGDAFVASEQVVPIDYNIWAAPGKTITQVSLFVDGIITEVHRFAGKENAIGYFETELGANKHYVFLEAIQSDGKRAWSSPMFITPPGLCGNVITWEGGVGAYSDDAEEALNGEVLLTSTDLELINDSEWRGEQTVGIRFNGVDIPPGSTILNAYIQFKVDETSSETTSLIIEGEDVDHAATFTTSTGDISSRARTEAEVVWAPSAWTTVGEADLNQRTPDLSSIIYEIINRPGWSPGNSMAFVITGTGKRVAVAYDGDRYGAPLLHVEYGTECPDNNPIPSISTLSPASAVAGGPAFTLTVNGSGFVSGSVVRWNGSDRTTTFVSSTQLTAAIPASDIAVAGTAQVTVFNPAPGGGTSNAQTFTIVTVNNPPVAMNDVYNTDANTTLSVPAPGVLGNDSDSEGDPLLANLVNPPGSGTLTLNADGSFAYTPNIGFSGTDSFTYVANDGATTSNIAAVNITVSAPQVLGSMHIGDLDAKSESIQKNKWIATVTISVHEANENPVADATVSGTWSGGYSSSYSCITETNGQCAVSTGPIPSPKTTVTLTINNITHATLSYDPTANHDPDGDSNGTVIAVSKP
jgi:hypothetical protein